MRASGHQLDTSAWGSAFAILEWKDVRYENQRLSSEALLEKWAEQFTSKDDPTKPDVETVVDGTVEAFIGGLANLIPKCGRNLQTLLVLCHGDHLGLCQSVSSEEHLSYSGFWESLSNFLDQLGSEETEDQINIDIGNGPGHGLVVIFGACYSMASLCNHCHAPKYLGSIVGFTGTPNISTVETVLTGYALHEGQGFATAQKVHYEAANASHGIGVIVDSLSAVAAISNQLQPSAPDPHGRYGDMTPDPDEGLLVEYCLASGRVRNLPLGTTKERAHIRVQEGPNE